MPPFHAVETDDCDQLHDWKDDPRLGADGTTSAPTCGKKTLDGMCLGALGILLPNLN